MEDGPEKQNRFARRVERIKTARQSTPSQKQKIAGFAFGTVTAFSIVYLCFVGIGIAPLKVSYLVILIAASGGLGALIGRRTVGKAGLAGIGAGLWIFLELMAAGLALLIEAFALGIGAAISSCSF